MQHNSIIQGNCLDVLQRIDNESSDMGFADPPFNLEKNYKSSKDNLDENEYTDWSCKWIKEMVRILKPGGSLLLHNIPKWLIRYCCILHDMPEMVFQHWIAWDAPTKPMGNSLQPAHYGILYYVKQPVCKKIFHEIQLPHKRCRSCKCLVVDYGGKKETIPPAGPIASDVWKDIHRIKHKKYSNDHPCQLPVHLMERIILMLTEADQLVVDPFMGTGTTAVAAKRLGRKYFGIDLDEGYIRLANERVARQVIPSRLNNIYVSCHRKEIISVRHEDVYRSHKSFRKKWTNLFKTWPTTGEERRLLNNYALQLKPKYSKLIRELENQLRENSCNPLSKGDGYDVESRATETSR